LSLIIVGTAWVEGEDECHVSDLSKSNGTGIECKSHGTFGYAALNQGVRAKRRTTGDYATMNELPTEYTDEGKSSDGRDKISKSLSNTAVKENKKALAKFRANEQQKYEAGQGAAGTSAYKYKERIDQTEPRGCGYPVCVDVDMRLKRFSSLCAFSKWMKETNQQDRVFMVQKGDCAHIIDNKEAGKKIRRSPWSKHNGRGRQAGKACNKHDGCNTKICLNDDGAAKTFQNVRQAMQHLSGGYSNYKNYRKNRRSMNKRNVIAIGLGDCVDLYQQGCINTEWFDLDDPVSDEVEEESVPYAHQLVISSDPKKMKTRFSLKGGKEVTMDSGESIRIKGQKEWIEKPHLGIHRSCPPDEIVGEAEFRTKSGESDIKEGKPGCHYSDTTLAFKCQSYKNKIPISTELSWDIVKKNVTCRDWKFRYCCKDMWGEAQSYNRVVRVDKPHIKQLSDGCKWRQYISTPKTQKGDSETKEFFLKNVKKGGGSKKNVCKGYALGTRFIDVRTSDPVATPFDEVPNQNILKISPVYGFICKGDNCKDYKVKYCCVLDSTKLKLGEWGKWSPWSKCDQQCGGGIQKRTRTCPDGEGQCYAAMDKPKEQERPCNKKECPTEEGDSSDLPTNGPIPTQPVRKEGWSSWMNWSDCSASCGSGKQTSKRTCKGPTCKEKQETRTKPCRSETCPKFEWGSWSDWAGCFVECDKVSTAIRQRKCYDTTKTPKKVCDAAECEGGESASTESGGKCPFTPCKLDGKWSEWDGWSFCNKFCEINRKRRCDSPPQKGEGKPCEGPSLETKKCKNPPEGKPCPKKVPCRSSEWGMWSSCSHFCGSATDAAAGFRERHRHIMSENPETCLGKNSTHVLKQTEKCIHCDDLTNENHASAEDFEHMQNTCLKNCPSDCKYGDWGEWEFPRGVCKHCRDPSSSKTYGEGTERFRTRSVVKEAENGGKPCEELKHTEPCPETVKCDNWKQWSEWTECKGKGSGCKSVKGVQERNRKCKTGKKCAKRVETDVKEGCFHMCKEIEPYQQWSEWSKCMTASKEQNGQPCGTGKRKRSRGCQNFISKTKEAVAQFCRYGETQSQEANCDLGPCQRSSNSGYGYL